MATFPCVVFVLLLSACVPAWSGTVPQDAKVCGDFYCRYNGTCLQDRCDCTEGYTGRYCQTKIEIPEYTVVYSDTVQLECGVNTTLTCTSIVWWKTIEGVKSVVNMSNTQKYSDGTLAKPNLKIYFNDFTDTGIYKCVSNYSDGTSRSSRMSLNVVGVKIVCGLLEENRVTLIYNGIAKEVIMRNYNGSTCPFVATNEKMNEFTLNANTYAPNITDTSNSTNITSLCRFQTLSETPSYIFSAKVVVREQIEGMEFLQDNIFDVQCSYTVTAKSGFSVVMEDAPASNPVVVAQPSGPKAQSNFTVELRSYTGAVLVSPKLGDLVMFKAVMTPAGNDSAFTVNTCQIYSDGKIPFESPVIVNGCGTGWPFLKTDGFTMKGLEGKSPNFKLPSIPGGGPLKIKCNFFVCPQKCDGTTCLKPA